MTRRHHPVSSALAMLVIWVASRTTAILWVEDQVQTKPAPAVSERTATAIPQAATWQQRASPLHLTGLETAHLRIPARQLAGMEPIKPLLWSRTRHTITPPILRDALWLPESTSPTVIEPTPVVVAQKPPFQLSPAPPQSGTVLSKYDGPPMSRKDRISISAWSLVRPRATIGRISDGQLGGSQIGVSGLAYIYSPSARVRVATSGRVSAALGSAQEREAALGFALVGTGKLGWRAGLERRVRFGKLGQSSWAALGVAGFDKLPIRPGLTASGYAQFGMVGRKRRDGFADASATIDFDLAHLGNGTLRAGLGAWGAVQPDLARFDLGPNLSWRPEKMGLPAISVQWRQRLAGNAAPASGPAITIGADF